MVFNDIDNQLIVPDNQYAKIHIEKALDFLTGKKNKVLTVSNGEYDFIRIRGKNIKFYYRQKKIQTNGQDIPYTTYKTLKDALSRILKEIENMDDDGYDTDINTTNIGGVNELYKTKYLKYKTKYLNLKNK